MSDHHDREWFVRTTSRYRKLQASMASKGCTCLLWRPQRIVEVLREGILESDEIDLLATYVLIGRPKDAPAAWCSHCEDLPMSRLVVDDCNFRHLTADEVDRILALEEPESLDERFTRGGEVRIRTGPFRGFTGRLVATHGRSEATVEVPIFARLVPTRISLHDLERLDHHAAK